VNESTKTIGTGIGSGILLGIGLGTSLRDMISYIYLVYTEGYALFAGHFVIETTQGLGLGAERPVQISSIF